MRLRCKCPIRNFSSRSCRHPAHSFSQRYWSAPPCSPTGLNIPIPCFWACSPWSLSSSSFGLLSWSNVPVHGPRSPIWDWSRSPSNWANQGTVSTLLGPGPWSFRRVGCNWWLVSAGQCWRAPQPPLFSLCLLCLPLPTKALIPTTRPNTFPARRSPCQSPMARERCL